MEKTINKVKKDLNLEQTPTLQQMENGVKIMEMRIEFAKQDITYFKSIIKQYKQKIKQK